MTTVGQTFTCEACGIELSVTKACEEENCDMLCCGKQMNTHTEPLDEE